MLLGGKFAKPIVSRGFVHSEHLTNKLKSPLILIQAPEGCLLTESLVAVLEELSRQVVWLRFGWEDFDPATCLLSLVEAFQVVSENIGTVTLKRMRRLPGPIQGWDGLFAQLGDEIKDCIPESTTLVLENLQHPARSPLTLALLGKHFLPALPEQIRVILLSQKNLPRYSLPQPSEIVNPQDLRITPATIDRLFQSTGLNSERASIRKAVRLTEGSPVGLTGICQAGQLLGGAYLKDALQRQTSRDGLFAQVARDWLDTLEEGDVQSAGTLLSLGYNHPVINQSQIGRPALTPSPWAQKLDQGWIRPHSLWLNGIEAALQANPVFRRESIHTAAEYLCRSGFLLPGIGLFLASQAISRAGEYLAQSADEMLSLGQWDLLKSWLERLPETFLTNQPRLLHAAGELKSSQGDLDGAADDFLRAREKYFQENDYAGNITSLLALSTLSARQGEANEAWSNAYQALQLAQSARLPRQESIAELQISLLALQSGDIQSALPHLELAGELARIAGDVALVERINDLHHLALDQEENQRQLQQKHRLYLAAQQAEQVHQERLQRAIESPLEMDTPGWSSQGWLLAPLTLKLGVALVTDGHVMNGKQGLLGKISTWLRGGMTNGDHRKAYTYAGERFEHPESKVPARLDHSVAEKPSVTPGTEIAPLDLNKELAPGSISGVKQPYSSVQPKPEPVQPRKIKTTDPTLAGYLLGEFRLVLEDVLVEHLPPGQNSALLKYLIHNHKRRISRDELMEVFWPEVEPESARNRLHVTMSKIRKALRHSTRLEIILFDLDRYFLNPELRVWVDVDQFENILAEAKRWVDEGNSDQAIRSLEVAANLYQGDFLADDIYDEWTVLTREHLRLAYLDALYQLSRYYIEKQQYAACAALCQSILARDNCREDVHCLLMRCYAHQGQIPLALRQYQICVQALRKELEVAPAASTRTLYEQLRQREITQPRPPA